MVIFVENVKNDRFLEELLKQTFYEKYSKTNIF